MIFGILSGVFWFLVFLTCKIGILHHYRIKNKSRIIIRLFLITILAGLVLSVFLGRSIPEITIGLVVMFSFFILYMPFYYTIASSVSIQSLVLLAEKRTHTSTMGELKQRFASAEIVSYKLKSMENSGLLLSNGETYKVTLKGRFVAWAFGLIKSIWNLGPGG
jgi:hypothetical protein